MNWIKAVGLMLMATCLVAQVEAEVPVSAYLSSAKTKDGRKQLEPYVAGMVSAFMWANAELESQKRMALFCPPRLLVLNVDNALALIDEWVKHPEFDIPAAREAPITMVLLSALRDQFPCK